MNPTQPPSVSIDEALRLFLALSYPNGPPEGVEPEKLLEAMRQQVAADRPEWAAADKAREPSTAESHQDPTYSQVKARIAEQARQEEIPEDPEERYLYERAQEARHNREQRREEEREDQVRERLRQRLLAEKKGADEATLERALRLRQALEERVRQVLRTEPLKLPRPAYETATPEESDASLSFTPPQGDDDHALPLSPEAPSHRALPPPARDPMSFESPRDLSPEDRIESLRRFNRARRERLRPRCEVLSTRRTERSFRLRESMELESGTTAGSMDLALENRDEDSEMTMSSNRRSRGLTFE